ncbi:ABC transporter ATP-binding protein [Variovorax defluvii]|uniref:ABC transporter ATP-binding protein n=1 Tax=Variovorax defluvii TaxID=913761 RepID=A0ABP8HFF6_9BURK
MNTLEASATRAIDPGGTAAAAEGAEVLRIEGLRAGYGAGDIVQGASLALAAGGALAVVGRNGVGKTTLLRAIAGQLPMTAGRRLLGGQDATHAESFELSRRGLAYIPADRQVFKTLSVRENLLLGAYAHGRGEWTKEAVIDRLFPRLGERYGTLAGSLSGGEQQMLTIARGLLSNPKVLLLDEPTEGLAPVMVDVFVQAMQRIRDSGVAMMLVEQNLAVPRKVATRYLVMDAGEVVWSGDAADLAGDAALVEKYLLL